MRVAYPAPHYTKVNARALRAVLARAALLDGGMQPDYTGIQASKHDIVSHITLRNIEKCRFQAPHIPTDRHMHYRAVSLPLPMPA